MRKVGTTGTGFGKLPCSATGTFRNLRVGGGFPVACTLELFEFPGKKDQGTPWG